MTKRHSPHHLKQDFKPFTEWGFVVTQIGIVAALVAIGNWLWWMTQ